jgi:hypothetical protein
MDLPGADMGVGPSRMVRATVWAVALICLAGAAAVTWFTLQHAYSLYDDAYIYLRYVDNLWRGCGLRFNCADAPVEGFTSPLYLALLTTGRLWTPDLETVTQVVGAVFMIAALVIPVAVGARLGHPWGPPGQVALAAAVALPLALDHHVLLNAVIGLETPVACVTVALLLAASLSDGRTGLRTALLLAVLARPECAAFVLFLPLLPEGRRLRYLAPLAGGLALVALARWLVFHDVAPNTFWAKSGGTREHLVLGGRYLWAVVTAHPLVLAAPLGLLAREHRPAITYLLSASALWLAFLVRAGGDTFEYGRLAMPLVPTLICLGVLGLATAAARIASALRIEPSTAGRLALGATLLVAAAAGTSATLRNHVPPSHGFDNVQRWSQVGRWLAARHPQDKLAVVPIGAIGYHSRAHVIDLVGLASREVAHAGRRLPPGMLTSKWIGHERHNTEWVLAQCPDLLVMTKWSRTPFRDLQATRAGFFAEWLLLRAIKEGRAPYDLHEAEVAPGVYWLMFRRRDQVGCPARRPPA